MRTAITVVPVFPDRADPGPEGGPGEYTCVFVLAYPGAEGYSAEVDADAFMRSGSSLLTFPPEVKNFEFKLMIEGHEYAMTIESNDRREAATVSATLNASNLIQAEALAYDNILPIVSLLAFRYNVGIAVRGCVITEVATNAQRIRLGLLGQSRVLANERIGIALTQEARMLLATYREASATSNIFLQALSYWKVIEGVYALRSKEAQEARDHGEMPKVRPRETIPATRVDLPYSDKWALDGFEDYLGKKFTFVRDELRERLRHGLAHLLPGDTDIHSLSADIFNDVSTCEEAVPVLRYMAQTLMTDYLAEHDLAAQVLSPDREAGASAT
jgi:hypothetical protein